MPALHLLDGVEWVLFDAVGTLIYPDPPVAEVYHSAGGRFGSQLSFDAIRERFRAALAAIQICGEPTSEEKEHDRWRGIVRSVLDDVSKNGEALFESLWQHFAEPQSWRTYDDVVALAELRRRGYKIGIASNFDGRLLGIVAAHSALTTCEFVFVSSSVGFTKPHGQFFRAIEERLRVSGAKIALVGDDEIADVQGATEAGWRPVRLDRSGDRDFPGTIRSLAELLQ